VPPPRLNRRGQVFSCNLGRGSSHCGGRRSSTMQARAVQVEKLS
jgi:hypothetical protein